MSSAPRRAWWERRPSCRTRGSRSPLYLGFGEEPGEPVPEGIRVVHLPDPGLPALEAADSLLDLVGNTPMVRLDRVAKRLDCEVLGKLELLNPGGSVKDRPAIAMVEAAEAAGLLGPGGTIVEPTSGNTGVGLAIIAARRHYRCVFVMPDKMSNEKIKLLRAYGAEVLVCPSAVEPEHPESYYSVANRLAAEIPGAFQPNQYHNMENPEAHVRSTGPEIWRQTHGRISHLVAGIGTGGTITRHRPLPQGAEPRRADRRRRPRRLRLLRRDGPALSGGGHRRGLLAHHLRRVGGRPGRARLRQGLVPHDPAGDPGGGAPHRRVRRHRRLRRPRGGQGPRPRARGRRHHPRLGPGLPVQDLRRRMDERLRVPHRRRADRRGRPRPQARRHPDARARPPRRDGPGRHRHHAGVRGLPGAGGAGRAAREGGRGDRVGGGAGAAVGGVLATRRSSTPRSAR